MRCITASSKTSHVPKYVTFAYLKEHLLSDIKGMLCDTFTFQQDSGPAHQAPETVELLSHATPDFISPDHWPSNRPGLSPADYKSWVSCSKACTKQRSMTYKTLEAGFAITLNRESLLTL